MDHRLRVLGVVVLTFVITISVGSVTEYIRESMVFSWNIEEGDMFIFDVIIRGRTYAGNTTMSPPFTDMNNTRISVQIISLPNASIVFYSSDFLQNIVEHQKISTIFENGTDIPPGYRDPISSHISQCVLPIGGWRHLDSFFPNMINRPDLKHESYLSAFRSGSFYFGFSSNETTESHVWYGIIDLETGVPHIVSFWIFGVHLPWTYSYNVTMSLVE